MRILLSLLIGLTVAGTLAARLGAQGADSLTVTPLTGIGYTADDVSPERVTFPAADGATVHGTWYRAPQPAAALVLAFHQGGASGEAEYAPIVPRLHREGLDVLVVDLRAGGGLFGGTNRTVEARGGEAGYCEALPDLEGALAYARDNGGGLPVVLWGSSFSAALVLRLAARHPDGVVAALAFSPASGEPMAGCRGEEVSEHIVVPVLAVRPRREMELASVAAQAALFREQGHRVFVADPGAHGSSMLVAERVDAPTDRTWEAVLAFLREVTAGQAPGAARPR